MSDTVRIDPRLPPHDVIPKLSFWFMSRTDMKAWHRIEQTVITESLESYTLIARPEDDGRIYAEITWRNLPVWRSHMMLYSVEDDIAIYFGPPSPDIREEPPPCPSG